MTDLLGTLAERGFVQDLTPGLEERLQRGPVTAYVGFDPTASSLHVGSLVPVMGLAWLQRLGGTPIALVGGGTGLVGDPSGKRAERPMLSVDEVDANAEGIRRQLAHFLDFTGARPARMVDNADWLRDLRLMEFLRDTGKHFTLSYMLQKESVKSRMDTGISYTEFSYMVVQAHDFWHLFTTQGCELQMGGSDQWGNITAGTELIRRREGAEAHGLVFPLLTTAAGGKFGKSEDGNIWLDARRTSPYKFYQYWFNTDDRDVSRFLKLFTFLPLARINEIVAEHTAAPQARLAQRVLAEELTALVHDPLTAKRMIQASRFIFGELEPATLGPDVLKVLATELESVQVGRERVVSGLSLVDALVEAGLASSKSDARRGLQQKGYSVNGRKAEDPDETLTAAHLVGDGYILLQKGKKHHAILVVGNHGG